MKTKLWWFVVLVLTASIVFVAMRKPPLIVDVGIATRGVVRSFVEEEGKTRVVNRYVISSPVGGRLLRVERQENEPVKQGDLLAEIDPLSLKSRVEEQVARLNELRRQLEGVETKKPKPVEVERSRVLEKRAKRSGDVAEREVEEARILLKDAASDTRRARGLQKKGANTEEDVEDVVFAEQRAQQVLSARELRVRVADFAYEAARLQTAILEAKQRDYDWEEAAFKERIAGVEAGLLVLRDDLKRARIISPADGVVLKRHVESETVVTAGLAILEVGDVTRLEVEADFLSEDVARMRVGMPAEIFGRALGLEVVRGKITRIYPSAFTKISSLGVEQQRVRTVVGFDPAGTGLGDLFRVDVRVILEERKDVIRVPESALFRRKGDWHLFRVTDDLAHLTKVETGLSDGRRREISKGVAAGDRIILHPGPDLEDGNSVEPRERE